MSELKAYIGPHPIDHTLTEYYLKSEADKVIAELRKERDWLAKDRAQAYDDLEKRTQLNIKQEGSNRHHKFKRCLAMAKACCEGRDSILTRNALRWRWWDKWFNRWLELAEKFKEGV